MNDNLKKNLIICLIFTAFQTQATDFTNNSGNFVPVPLTEINNQSVATQVIDTPILLTGIHRTLACFEAAEKKFSIPIELLLGIAERESSFNPKAVGINKNGSRDYGLMQINSSWIPTLSKFGVDPQSLFDPCISIDVAAWILSDNIKRFGRNWQAIARYNAAKNIEKGLVYATNVFDRAKRIQLDIGRDKNKLINLLANNQVKKKANNTTFDSVKSARSTPTEKSTRLVDRQASYVAVQSIE